MDKSTYTNENACDNIDDSQENHAESSKQTPGHLSLRENFRRLVAEEKRTTSRAEQQFDLPPKSKEFSSPVKGKTNKTHYRSREYKECKRKSKSFSNSDDDFTSYSSRPKTSSSSRRAYVPRSNIIKIDTPGDKDKLKSFNDFQEDLFQMDEETKTFICPVPECGKDFPSLSRIKRHYIIHTDIKPFVCKNKECDKRFSRKDNMLQHYRMHCPYTRHH